MNFCRLRIKLPTPHTSGKRNIKLVDTALDEYGSLKIREGIKMKTFVRLGMLLLSSLLLGSQAFAAHTCTATVSSNQAASYQVDVTVTNSGTTAISGWTVTLNFPETVTVTNQWNVASRTGARLTAKCLRRCSAASAISRARAPRPPRRRSAADRRATRPSDVASERARRASAGRVCGPRASARLAGGAGVAVARRGDRRAARLGAS